MEECIEHTELFEQDDTTYLLDRIIWEKYDMVETKNKVIDFLLKYKKARATYIGSFVPEDWGLTTNYNITKTSSSFRNTGGFAELSNKKLDAEYFINTTSSLIVRLKKSFTKDEKLYFEHCLASNVTEANFCLMMDLTKFRLKSIKNSCLLKIAFATHNAVRKDKH